MQIKKIVLLLFSFSTFFVHAQDVNILLKEAENLEFQLKENESLEKYKQVLTIDTANIKALTKAAELTAMVGARFIKEKEKKTKASYFQAAYQYAQKAIALNNQNADANYVMAFTSGKLTDVETDNKKIVAYIKDTKLYAEKTLAINLNYAKANYILGKWNLEMVNLNGLKKAAVKLFYGVADGSLDNAIAYMEKCKKQDQYYMLNYLDLAKAYQQDHQAPKAIEVLQKMIKLPLRTADDAALKEEGKQLLNSLQ